MRRVWKSRLSPGLADMLDELPVSPSTLWGEDSQISQSEPQSIVGWSWCWYLLHWNHPAACTQSGILQKAFLAIDLLISTAANIYISTFVQAFSHIAINVGIRCTQFAPTVTCIVGKAWTPTWLHYSVAVAYTFFQQMASVVLHKCRKVGTAADGSKHCNVQWLHIYPFISSMPKSKFCGANLHALDSSQASDLFKLLCVKGLPADAVPGAIFGKLKSSYKQPEERQSGEVAWLMGWHGQVRMQTYHPFVLLARLSSRYCVFKSMFGPTANTSS